MPPNKSIINGQVKRSNENLNHYFYVLRINDDLVQAEANLVKKTWLTDNEIKDFCPQIDPILLHIFALRWIAKLQNFQANPWH